MNQTKTNNDSLEIRQAKNDSEANLIAAIGMEREQAAIIELEKRYLCKEYDYYLESGS